jgi:hypothetical protein
MTKKWEFESQYSEEFSLFDIVQTVSGAHPVSYPIGTGGSLSPGVKKEGCNSVVVVFSGNISAKVSLSIVVWTFVYT